MTIHYTTPLAPKLAGCENIFGGALDRDPFICYNKYRNWLETRL